VYARAVMPDGDLLDMHGILSAQGDDMRAARAKIGVNVAATNADGTDMLPMPTVVIIDTAGTIRWIDVHPNYTIRTEPPRSSPPWPAPAVDVMTALKLTVQIASPARPHDEARGRVRHDIEPAVGQRGMAGRRTLRRRSDPDAGLRLYERLLRRREPEKAA